MPKIRLCWMEVVLCLFVSLSGCGNGDEAEQGCSPEAKQCSGQYVLQCNVSGTSWSILTGCNAGCVGGECVIASCQPSCAGKQCGNDGCYGSCGECPGDKPYCNGWGCFAECASDEGCTEPGVSICLDETTHHACEQVMSGCYQWGQAKSCEDGFVCQQGGCVSPAQCGEAKPVVEGIVKNSIADMDFTGEEVNIQLFHKLDIDEWEDGCISRYVMDFSKMGLGCKFHLEMNTSPDAVFSVTSAILEADSFCPGWSDADEGKYVLESSSLTMCSTVKVADHMSESSCIPNVVVGFGGVLNLVRQADGKKLEVDLSTMTVQGDITSLGDTELVCPEPCAKKECGGDGCDGSCGDCAGSQELCLEGICVCSPDCNGKECEGDGCGGTCGTCDCGESCDDGMCVFHNCDALDCGDDGCGGICGECACGASCLESICVYYKCKGKECGDDGCGGVCGNCGDEGYCTEFHTCMYTPIWTDPASNLMWQNPPSEEATSWSNAKSICGDLVLGGHDDWRLPTVEELRTLIRGCEDAQLEGNCNLAEDECLSFTCRDESCNGCAHKQGPSGGCYWPDEMLGLCYWYWSSSGVVDPGYDSWFVYFSNGFVGSYAYLDGQVRCVR